MKLEKYKYYSSTICIAQLQKYINNPETNFISIEDQKYIQENKSESVRKYIDVMKLGEHTVKSYKDIFISLSKRKPQHAKKNSQKYASSTINQSRANESFKLFDQPANNYANYLFDRRTKKSKSKSSLKKNRAYSQLANIYLQKNKKSSGKDRNLSPHLHKKHSKNVGSYLENININNEGYPLKQKDIEERIIVRKKSERSQMKLITWQASIIKKTYLLFRCDVRPMQRNYQSQRSFTQRKHKQLTKDKYQLILKPSEYNKYSPYFSTLSLAQLASFLLGFLEIDYKNNKLKICSEHNISSPHKQKNYKKARSKAFHKNKFFNCPKNQQAHQNQQEKKDSIFGDESLEDDSELWKGESKKDFKQVQQFQSSVSQIQIENEIKSIKRNENSEKEENIIDQKKQVNQQLKQEIKFHQQKQNQIKFNLENIEDLNINSNKSQSNKVNQEDSMQQNKNYQQDQQKNQVQLQKQKKFQPEQQKKYQQKALNVENKIEKYLESENNLQQSSLVIITTQNHIDEHKSSKNSKIDSQSLNKQIGSDHQKEEVCNHQQLIDDEKSEKQKQILENEIQKTEQKEGLTSQKQNQRKQEEEFISLQNNEILESKIEGGASQKRSISFKDQEIPESNDEEIPDQKEFQEKREFLNLRDKEILESINVNIDNHQQISHEKNIKTKQFIDLQEINSLQSKIEHQKQQPIVFIQINTQKLKSKDKSIDDEEQPIAFIMINPQQLKSNAQNKDNEVFNQNPQQIKIAKYEKHKSQQIEERNIEQVDLWGTNCKKMRKGKQKIEQIQNMFLFQTSQETV